MKGIRQITSKDNIEYTIDVSEKVVRLTDGQLASLESTIQELESKAIDEGLILYNIPDEQSQRILEQLNEIICDFSVAELIEQEIIDFTTHARERMGDRMICIDRRWTYRNAPYEIAECLKRSYSVEQIRLRFDKISKKSWEQLAFKIKGNIGKGTNRRDGEVVINFDEDPIEGDQIMVITILKSEY